MSRHLGFKSEPGGEGLAPNLIVSGAPIQEAIALLEQPECSGLFVIEPATQRLAGILEIGDVRRAILRGVAYDAQVDEIMQPAPVALIGTQLTAESLGSVMKLTSFGSTAQAAAEESAKVVILAGGEGRRLGSLTATVPKPLLPVGGKPLLETTVRRLARSGFSDICLAVLYRADLIESHFGDGSRYGASVRYVHETSPLGTAGAIRLACGDDRPVTLVMNGDILTTLRFGEMVAHHRRRHNDVTVAMKVLEVSIPYGVLEVDEYEIQAIREKPIKRYFVSAGIYVLGPEAIDLIPFNRRFDMTDVISTAIAKGYRVGGFPIVEYWTDIGLIDDYKAANLDYGRYFAPWERIEATRTEIEP
jgi:dTDP-glucose pyrophosphorylase